MARASDTPTRTACTVKNFVGLPASSRARGSFVTRLKNCGQIIRFQIAATISMTVQPTGSSMSARRHRLQHRGEKAQAVGARSTKVLNRMLGVQHESDDIAALIGDPGNILPGSPMSAAISSDSCRTPSMRLRTFVDLAPTAWAFSPRCCRRWRRADMELPVGWTVILIVAAIWNLIIWPQFFKRVTKDLSLIHI